MTTASPMPGNAALDAALSYAARGWPVFPLHSPALKGCSCGKNSCSAVGKHPRTSNGLKDASVDPAIINAWWDRWPMANVAIATGAGLLVIDIDIKKNGRENWETLVEGHGKPPSTVEALTGGGGSHLLFLVDRAVPNSSGLLADGIDVRGDGGYIVAPPSRHASGKRYEWEASSDPSAVKPAEVPPWLLSLCLQHRASTPTSSAPLADAFPEGKRNESIYTLGCSLWAKGLTDAGMRAALLAENQARCSPPLDEVEVSKICDSIVKNKPRGWSKEFRDKHGPPTLRVVPPDETSDAPADPSPWTDALSRTKEGSLKNSFANICALLRHSPAYVGLLAWNEMRLAPELDGRALADGDLGRLREAIELEWGISPSVENLALALRTVAEEKTYHPVRQYLATLKWDGVERIDHVASDILNANANELTIKQLRCWFISAAARALHPGCKVDNVLVLIGRQGGRKSTFFAELAGPWFSDTHMDLTNKDAYMQLADAWIYEWGEIEKVTGKRGADEVKAFVTSRADVFRPPFGRNVVRQPRSCVVVGTTNEDEFLTDPTGSRRFWVVRVRGRIDVEGLREQRDQLWAESVHRYNSGEPWWLSDDEEAIRDRASREHYVSDSWERPVADYLTSTASSEVTCHALLSVALKLDNDKMNRQAEMRVGQIMHRLGWVNARRRERGRQFRVWVKYDAACIEDCDDRDNL